MSRITHERMKAIIDFNSEYYEEIIDYIAQQERLDNELTNTMIIANSRLERLNGLELEYDKQNELLELYRQLVKDLGLIIEYDMTDTWSGLEDYEYLEINCDSIKALNTYKQIKELEND